MHKGGWKNKQDKVCQFRVFLRKFHDAHSCLKFLPQSKYRIFRKLVCDSMNSYVILLTLEPNFLVFIQLKVLWLDNFSFKTFEIDVGICLVHAAKNDEIMPRNTLKIPRGNLHLFSKYIPLNCGLVILYIRLNSNFFLYRWSLGLIEKVPRV